MQKNGLVDIAELEAAIRPETALVSIMGVNNEIGVIQPLKEIGQVHLEPDLPMGVVLRLLGAVQDTLCCLPCLTDIFVHLQLCRRNKVFFHTDLAQMAGKMPVDVNDLNIDVASLSSHKVHSTLL